jgi:hypothetical protein
MDPDLDPKGRHSIDQTVATPTNHEKPNHRNIFNQDAKNTTKFTDLGLSNNNEN